MEIKPPSGPAAMPEPDDTPTAPAPAGPVKAGAHLASTQDQLGVYQPPVLDFGEKGLERLHDASDLPRIPGGLGERLPGGFDRGPTEATPGQPPRVPDPPPDPPERPDELVSKFRIPREGLGAYSPEIGGTEQGPDGNPKRPAIRHGIGPGHIKTPVPGSNEPTEPGGFVVPGTPTPTDPRASSPVPRPEPAPSPPDPDDPDDPDDASLRAEAALSGLAAGVNRQSPAGYQDGDDLPAFAGLVSGDLGAAAMGETARGISDPGPPTNPPDPPPK
ncbi:MAG TPA: hypothetical protein PKM55_11785 [Acidobacteriota bacterium]|nr:hypothetical protein [Acidobacteriota bacterium]